MTAPESIAAKITKPDIVLSELLERRAEFLGFLTRRVGDPAAAEDILQAAYTKALEKGGQIENTESVVAWFYRMLRNAVIDDYRRNDARARAHEQFAAEAPLSYESEAEVNLCACVGGVIQTLKPEYRTALERIDFGGESIADFAHAEGTTPNNVSVRLHRARRAAAKKLTQVCGACADHKCLDCTCKHQV
jgi:RNA polymerase sigma factor (sigma-70 family)